MRRPGISSARLLSLSQTIPADRQEGDAKSEARREVRRDRRERRRSSGWSRRKTPNWRTTSTRKALDGLSSRLPRKRRRSAGIPPAQLRRFSGKCSEPRNLEIHPRSPGIARNVVERERATFATLRTPAWGPVRLARVVTVLVAYQPHSTIESRAAIERRRMRSLKIASAVAATRSCEAHVSRRTSVHTIVGTAASVQRRSGARTCSRIRRRPTPERRGPP